MSLTRTPLHNARQTEAPKREHDPTAAIVSGLISAGLIAMMFAVWLGIFMKRDLVQATHELSAPLTRSPGQER